MIARKVSRRVVGLGLAVVVISALAMPAQATVSVGASVDCDPDGHCVTGGAEAVNVGARATTVTEGEGLADDAGVAEAMCWGAANGSTLIQITCTHGNQSNTRSFPGTAGAVPLATTSARLERLPVCWRVTAWFPTGLGPEVRVVTQGCELLGV